MPSDVLQIGIVAGEESGDILGAGMVESIRRQLPETELRLRGIGGPRLSAQGLQPQCQMSDISIMGFDGLLTSLPRILQIRRALIRDMLRQPPDLFVGIDVPDFNLTVESRLKRRGIPTVHYVSPTVWAWRSYRIGKIRKSVDHMLTLFPFEADFYRRHDVPVTFVGHPMADEIAGTEDGSDFRREFGLTLNDTVIGILPGSRRSEIDRLAEIFLHAAARLLDARPAIKFVTPFASAAIKDRFEAVTDAGLRQRLGLISVIGRARETMAASDVVLLASGTAALEAALLRRPMVVSYRASRLTEVFFRLFGEVEHFSMPNHLLAQPDIPELIQDDATPENLSVALQAWLDAPDRRQQFRQDFDRVHQQLKRNASEQAASVVTGMLARSTNS